MSSLHRLLRIPAARLTRGAAALLGLASVVLTGCMTFPQHEDVVAWGEPVAFQGYALASRERVQVRAFDPHLRRWVTLATVWASRDASLREGFVDTDLGPSPALYAWSTRIRVPDRFWEHLGFGVVATAVQAVGENNLVSAPEHRLPAFRGDSLIHLAPGGVDCLLAAFGLVEADRRPDAGECLQEDPPSGIAIFSILPGA